MIPPNQRVDPTAAGTDAGRPRVSRGRLGSRGNGWVIAGLIRVLDDMPPDYPDGATFEPLVRRGEEVGH